MMLRLGVILGLTGLGFTLEEYRFFEFMKDTCHFTYGQQQGQWETINDMQCAKACMQHDNCYSLMYEKATRQCFLNAEMQENMSQFPADCGVQYAESRFYGCDGGWQYIAEKCYLYVDQLLTWQGCDDYCISEQSYLAKLYTPSTLNTIYNVTHTGWTTATMAYGYYPWITVNDLIAEGVYTDRDGVPLGPELIPHVYPLNDLSDCGIGYQFNVYMYNCASSRSCVCEKEPRIITKRPIQL